MTWIIYTRLTAHNRAAEALVALFCLFWAGSLTRLATRAGPAQTPAG